MSRKKQEKNNSWIFMCKATQMWNWFLFRQALTTCTTIPTWGWEITHTHTQSPTSNKHTHTHKQLHFIFVQRSEIFINPRQTAWLHPFCRLSPNKHITASLSCGLILLMNISFIPWPAYPAPSVQQPLMNQPPLNCSRRPLRANAAPHSMVHRWVCKVKKTVPNPQNTWPTVLP